MPRILALAVAAAFASVGCSNVYDSAAMGVHYKPPRGVQLLHEQPGPPTLAQFEDGLELRSVPGDAVAVDESKLATLLAEVCPKAGVDCGGEVMSSRIGTVGTKAVARYTIKSGDNKRLVYYIPHGKRFLLLTFTATAGHYADVENHVELSLASLKFKD
jgi:hypothetical protein